MDKTDIILGIDLGTTYSAAAYVNKNGTAEIIPNSENERVTPSVVFFEQSENEVVVGQFAKDEAISNPDNVVSLIKREIGKPPDHVRFGNPYRFWNRIVTPEEISSFIIRKIKEDSEEFLNTKITEAVITVPAYFSDIEREATIKAGELAGLKVKRIINEPTAAALYFGLDKADADQKVFIFDLGGGTFDVTILDIVSKSIRVIGTDGDHQLGGADWDNKIVEHISEKYILEFGEDPLDDPEAKADLFERAERAKKQLSVRENTNILLNAFGNKIKVDLDRNQFEEMADELLDRCRTLCSHVLETCDLNWSDIDQIVLVGGSTRMPMISNMLIQESGKDVSASLVNPDECVALGAAIQGQLLMETNLGIGSQSNTAKFGIGEIIDVTAHSLGMVTLKNGQLKNSIIIPRNQSVPCEKSRNDFVTSYDNQETLDVYLVQGESDNPFHCVILNSYEFYDIPPRPKGQSQIQVTFEYDNNGVVHAFAVDLKTGKSLPSNRKTNPNLEELLAGAGKPMDIGLLIDCSGSMYGTLIEDAKKAGIGFVDTINLGANQIGVISFGSDAKLEQELCSNPKVLHNTINSLDLTGSTNMAAAIRIARSNLLHQSKNDKVIVLLTDGYPDSSSSTLSEGDSAKSSGIKIITIGVGKGVDQGFLTQLASSADDYHFVNQSFELESAFVNIATELSSGNIGM